ncbi:hypothetical protein NFC73_20440 [Pseudarthrobacter sp. RMG13]|uniref:DUF2393 domain-containing protein n=1 Tax=Pseudarthrobacter humi TaxID=2952523 RepID=A0ABT1LUC5_9MICC|nr:hypothetical protein [Pseudarthrobacter humi]MCP9002075.1 hypothetical protein [Pseudarthrobacter humi]
MSTETLAIIGPLTGAVGALAAVVSLLWQVSVHRRSGPVIQVKSSYSIPVYGPDTAPEFHGPDFVAVEVRNRGGKSVTVTNYGVSLGGRKPSDNMFVLDRPVWATTLPAPVEPGGVPTQVLVPVPELRKAHSTRGIPFNKMVPWVELGDGRRVYSTNPVPLK